MSSAAEDFAGIGGFYYHVPHHSRREKLRFPPEDSPATATSSLPFFYQSGASFLPSYQIQSQGFSLSLSPAALGPLGPFTGYAAVLNRSGFVEPARQLLEEICRFGRGEFAGSRDPPEAYAMESQVQKIGVREDGQWKKLKLVSMLDEVYKRYRLYYQQIETVIASFETVAGLNTASPYVSMALKSMSKSFLGLKNLISTNLSSLSKVDGEEGHGKGEDCSNTCSQRRNFSLAFGQPQHAWRPQRGLPERAVGVLRAWLFDHFLHPYPTDSDKQMLAKQTGLTRNQVSNWFINARVRLWKPMVEEIHNLEVHQSQKALAPDHNSSLQPSQPPPPPSPAAASSSNRPPAGIIRSRSNDLNESRRHSIHQIPHIEEPYRFLFNEYADHGNIRAASGMANSSVSLSLGLPEQVPVNVARRFGLEECSNAYVVSNGYDGQERGYGKDIGAHMLHDFVG